VIGNDSNASMGCGPNLPLTIERLFVEAAGLKFFIGLSSFEMLAMFRRGLFYAYLSIYLRHFLGLSVTETTLFATLPMALNILAQSFVWGRVSDYFQLRRSLIVVGEILAAIGTLILWYIHRIMPGPSASGYAIIIGLTIIEIFWSMSNIAHSALISDIFEPQTRNQVLGRLSSMGGIGRMAGIWIGGLLYDGLGLQFEGWGFYQGPLFFISSAVMLISTAPLFWLPEGGTAYRAEIEPATNSQASPSSSVFLFFLVGMIFVNFGRNSIAIIFPQYLTLDGGPAVDSRTLSYIVNTQSAAVILLGWIAGRIGRILGNDMTLLAATATAACALVFLAVSSALPIIYLGSFLRGVGDVIILAAAYAYASVLIPPQFRARRFAWFNATFFLSFGLAGTLIAGPLVDTLLAIGYAPDRAYRLSFAAAAGLTVIGFSILLALISYRRRAIQTQSIKA
jgi:MFS family permease